jgi:hypothetical protein
MYSHNESKFADALSQPKAKAKAAAGGTFGSPPPGLKMVRNIDYDEVSNPFAAWVPGTQEFRARISNASQNGQPHLRVSVHMRTLSITFMWLWGVLAFHVPKILRGILSLVRMWRTAVVTVVRAFPQTCYYEDDEITNIVGLVPPTHVMLGKPKKGQEQTFGQRES